MWNVVANKQIQKKNSKIPSESEEIIIFCQIFTNWDEGNQYSCCYLIHGYSTNVKHNVTIHTLVSKFLYLSKELYKKASELCSRLELWWLVPNSTIMAVADILRSRLLKCLPKEKKYYIFVTELKFQVRLSMQSIHRNTVLLV